MPGDAGASPPGLALARVLFSVRPAFMPRVLLQGTIHEMGSLMPGACGRRSCPTAPVRFAAGSGSGPHAPLHRERQVDVERERRSGQQPVPSSWRNADRSALMIARVAHPPEMSDRCRSPPRAPPGLLQKCYRRPAASPPFRSAAGIWAAPAVAAPRRDQISTATTATATGRVAGKSATRKNARSPDERSAITSRAVRFCRRGLRASSAPASPPRTGRRSPSPPNRPTRIAGAAAGPPGAPPRGPNSDAAADRSPPGRHRRPPSRRCRA